MSIYADPKEAAPGNEEPHPRSTSSLSGTKRRSRPEIYFTILSLIGEKPTSLLELAVETRLNFSAAKKALELLIWRNLVCARIVDGRVYYIPTQRGLEFACSFNTMSKYIE